MKMSDVFDLPLVDDDLWHCIQDDKYGEKEEAAAHAINMHDELVDALDCALACWLEDCDPTELYPVVNKAMSILTRAKGEE